MIIVYSDDAKRGVSAVKKITDTGGSARYVSPSQFYGPKDMEDGVTEAWLLDGPHKAIESAYGKRVVAKYGVPEPEKALAPEPETKPETPTIQQEKTEETMQERPTIRLYGGKNTQQKTR